MNGYVYLIDGNALFYRSFYAIKGLTDRDDKPTGAVYGFTSTLFKLIREGRPEAVSVAFDLPFPTFRHRLFPDYKAQRPKMPSELQMQIPRIKEIVCASGVSMFECAGFEADDIIGTIAKEMEVLSKETRIFTTDKDYLQLVSPLTKVMMGNLLYDETLVREKWGVGPERIVDVLSLSGDATDNIKGVPGVGKVTAMSLIRQFGGVEDLLERLTKIDRKGLRENLSRYTPEVYLNKKLITINRDVPLSFDFDGCRLKQADIPRLQELFRKLDFKWGPRLSL